MKTIKAFSSVCLCLLTGGFIASGAPASKSATPLTFANAVSFFKAAKFRATEAASSHAKNARQFAIAAKQESYLSRRVEA
jgi:hypothetical protein